MASHSPENQLIAGLPVVARRRLLALCTAEPLQASAVLYEAGGWLRQVYFPLQGFVALVAQREPLQGLQVGMVGREGMLGVLAALGPVRSPLRALVLGAGTSRRIGAAAFRLELSRSAPLRELVHRYLGVTLAQLAATATCQRFHSIGQRVARWLLMSHDRTPSGSFHVTHEVMSLMLGARRAGVSTAAGQLQRAGCIHYHRGEVTVVDRVGLERLACSCYAADRRCYDERMSTRGALRDGRAPSGA